MDIYLTRGTEQNGPYSPGMLRQLLEEGAFDGSELACRPGLNEWVKLDELKAFACSDTECKLHEELIAIAKARAHMPREPRIWVVCGGGRKNKTLMSMLASRVQNAVAPVEVLGFDGDAIEAQAWAYMAVRRLDELPITFPETTGVPAPMTGGVIAAAGG